MKFGIAGPISKDHVILPTGARLEKYGAVAYAISTMAKLLEDSADEAICLSHLSSADFEVVSSLLHHPNIDLSGLTALGNGTTEIELIYSNERDRRSRQINVMPPLTPAGMSLLSACAAVLLMPLNETDISLECVKKLKNSSDAVIFLDAHGLVTGVSEDGIRHGKVWPDAREWFDYIDILKMNESETSWVAGHPMKQYEEFIQFAAGIVQFGVNTCWITFGNQSSLIAWRRENRTYWASVPVVTDIGPVLDTTGCGDASSAGFIYAYTKFYHNPLQSVIMGNTLGSLKATFQETDAFPSRPEIREVIGGHYREYLHALLDDFLARSQLIVHESKGGQNIESFMYHADRSNSPGTDHARGGGGQGAPAQGA